MLVNYPPRCFLGNAYVFLQLLNKFDFYINIIIINLRSRPIMPYHIEHLIYSPSFFKDFSAAKPKPANSFNSFINIFLFYYGLFSNRNSCIFFYSKREQYADIILYLTAVETRLITIKTRSIAPLLFDNIKNNHTIIGKNRESTCTFELPLPLPTPFQKERR